MICQPDLLVPSLDQRLKLSSFRNLLNAETVDFQKADQQVLHSHRTLPGYRTRVVQAEIYVPLHHLELIEISNNKSFSVKFNICAEGIIFLQATQLSTRYTTHCLIKVGLSYKPKSSNVHEFGFVSPDAALPYCSSAISLILVLQKNINCLRNSSLISRSMLL